MAIHVLHGVKLILQQGDIVTVEADAIVNAANSGLAGGGGVDGAIHRAGGPEIMQACRKIGGCQTGSAVATTAGNLHARFIFHAVGPVYQAQAEDQKLLASSYQRCLELAEHYQLQSIAFPSISTGAYRYPVRLAAEIALNTILEHINKPTSLQQIYFVLFDSRTYQLYQHTLERLLSA